MPIEVLLDNNSASAEVGRRDRSSGWGERFNDDPYPDLFFAKPP